MKNSQNPDKSGSKNIGFLTKEQSDYLLEVTEYVYNLPISYYFREINPNSYHRYKEIIKKVIDLDIIIKKINGNSYKSVSAWKDDFQLLFKNSMTYNPEGTLVHQIAQELKLIFDKKTQDVPKNEFDVWKMKLREEFDKLNKLIEYRPDE